MFVPEAFTKVRPVMLLVPIVNNFVELLKLRAPSADMVEEPWAKVRLPSEYEPRVEVPTPPLPPFVEVTYLLPFAS